MGEHVATLRENCIILKFKNKCHVRYLEINNKSFKLTIPIREIVKTNNLPLHRSVINEKALFLKLYTILCIYIGTVNLLGCGENKGPLKE